MKIIAFLALFVFINSCNVASVVTGTTSTNLGDNFKDENVNLSDDILHFYRMESAPNSDKFDSINSNNLADTNYEVQSISGIVGNAVDCGDPQDPTSGPYLPSSSGFSISIGTNYNFSFWYKWNASNAPGTQYRVFNISSTYIEFQDLAGPVQDLYWNFNSTAVFVGAVLNSSDIGNWVHISLNVDTTNGFVSVYKNGSKIYSNVATGISVDGAGSFQICSGGGGEAPPNAGIDSFGIWTRMLNDDEIKALYNRDNDLD